MNLLTKYEELLLISIYKLGNEAYGAKLKKYIFDTTGKDWNYGNLYCTLDQLVKKKYIRKSTGEPTRERGGRSKNYYDLTNDGTRVLEETLEMNRNMLNGLDSLAVKRS